MRRFRSLAWVPLLLLPTLPAAGDLPPIDCVRLLRQARIATMAGNQELALARLVEATKVYPDQVEPVVALIEHQREFGAPPEELARLRSILTRRLEDPERPVLPGTLRVLVLNPDAEPEELEIVLRAVERRLGTASDDSGLLGALAVLQERLGRTEALHQTLRRLLELDPTNGTLWRCLALDRERDHWDEAAEHLAELVRREPEVPFLRMGYIEALGKTGRFTEALEQLDLVGEQATTKIFGMELGLTELLLQLAWDLRDLGQVDEAESIFRRILRFDPEDRTARQAILYLYSTPAERQAHEATLQQQWSEESDPEQLLVEGSRLLASRDFERAIELLDRAARELTDSEPAQFNLGLVAINLERWELAAHALGRAIELNASRAESHLNHGIALHYLDRCNEAVVSLERGLELQPDLTQAHYYLYECHRRLGNDDAAAEHRERYNAAAKR